MTINKNSIYVGALTSFILDTKPYHSKLSEVQEIYQFFDEMTVRIDERFFNTVLTKAAWPYSYFSGGPPESIPGVGQPMPLHQLVSPLVRGYTRNNDPLQCRGAFKAFRDENIDLPLVPFAFDPHQIQGAGLRDAFIQRDGIINTNEPLLEGHDIFLSKGAYVFQIKQTVNTQPPIVGRYNKEWSASDAPFPILVTLPFTNADSLDVSGPAVQVSLTEISVTGAGIVKIVGFSNSPNYNAQITERQKENVLAQATSTVQINALDTLNPNSAVNKIIAIMNLIAAQLLITPNAPASAELALIQTALSTPVLPNSYDALFTALLSAGTPVIAGYVGWRGQDVTAPYTDRYVDDVIAALSPGLYFNQYTDLKIRESATLRYDDVAAFGISITNINANPFSASYEEWTLTATSSSILSVRGSSSGVIGIINLPSGVFNSTHLGFTYSGPSTVLTGSELVLTPSAEITVHYQAPLEAWSIIKTNPLAYSRPVLSSTRYGFIRSQSLVRNQITILDAGMPSSTIVLTAISPTVFVLTSTAEPLYTANITVNIPFNDGRTAFTIVAGSAYAFTAGDKFYIGIENQAPFAEDLDMYYGYDFDPYDAGSPSFDEFGVQIAPTGPMVYDTINTALAVYLRSLDFNFDSRFVAYDLSSFGLALAPNVASDVQYRLRAVPNLTLPLNLHPINSPSTALNQVSVIATNDPTNPLAVLQVDMVNDAPYGIQSSNDPDVIADLLLYYASSFAFERYDISTATWVLIDTIGINIPYTSTAFGVSFTIVPGDKPFIAAILNSSRYDSTVPGLFISEQVLGGDVLAWTVKNSAPVQLEPATLISTRVPRLIMYGDSYHFSIPAVWTMTFVGVNQYSLQGVYTTGAQNGLQVLPTPVLVNITTEGKSFKNDGIGLHFTVIAGSAGLASTDSFTFTTFERKPSYLVHGSVSGWQPEATVGEWYWNGKIGFKIESAQAHLFDSTGTTASWNTPFGSIVLNYLRKDTQSTIYRIKSHAVNHWSLYRNGAIVGDGDFIVADKFISIEMPNAPVGTEYIINVVGQTRPLTIAHDLAIVRVPISRTPTADDFILIERTESDTLSISIKPVDIAHSLTLSSLAPVTTDLRFVDHFALSGVPLSATSPETAVLSGWIPVLETRLDMALSIAEFSDAQTHVVVRAAGTGEKVGDVISLGSTASEPVIFRWDPAFHTKYLPLNAQATIVTLGSGMDDRMNVNMTDEAIFLISSGGLIDDALFSENINISITDTSFLSITSTYEEASSVLVSDGPFVGFLPGYDNLAFDFESGTGDVNDENTPDGYYDAGVPLTDMFQQAQGLSLLPILTAPQQALLNDLTSLLNPWLDGNISSTTLAEFLTNVGAQPPALPLYNNIINWTPTQEGFGIPAIGMGMEIETQNATVVGTNFAELAIININDFGYAYDVGGLGVGALEARAEKKAVLYTSLEPPIFCVIAPYGLYADFQTPLHITVPTSSFELVFADPIPSTTPVNIYYWTPEMVQPEIVSGVQRMSDNTFTFTLPAPTEVKLFICVLPPFILPAPAPIGWMHPTNRFNVPYVILSEVPTVSPYLLLHPGPAFERPVIRFNNTIANGAFTITLELIPDGQGTPNDATLVFNGVVLGVATVGVPFSITINMVLGDWLEFVLTGNFFFGGGDYVHGTITTPTAQVINTYDTYIANLGSNSTTWQYFYRANAGFPLGAINSAGPMIPV